MNKKIKILITSAGSTHGINVIKALRGQKELGVFLIAADMNDPSAAFYLADRYYTVPPAADLGFVDFILKLCKKEKIKIIIPTYSAELPIFAKNKKLFQERGILMAIPGIETLLICENKITANEEFLKLGVPIPKVYSEIEIVSGKIEFPAIVKPVQGSGSKGVVKVNDKKDLDFFRNYVKNSFVQEFAAGQEYGIDGICDLEGRLIGVSPRIRNEVRGGLAVKSATVKDGRLEEYAKKIAEGLKIIGPFNIQCFKDGDKIKFIEINCRFPSGGLPLTVKAGLNMPLIAVKLLLGMAIGKPKIKEGLVMARYWDAVILKKDNNGKLKPI
jgi:carbamoyl-phosphate synthase large subunit